MSSVEDRIESVESLLGFQVRSYQRQALTALGQGKNVILHAPTGCHAPGQLILMLDGSTKKVEDIKKGDLLMGPDSKPRRVTRLIRGRGRMVKVLPKKGESFVVNEDHILTLVRTGVIRAPADGSRKRRDLGGELVDVKVKDWETWSSTQKHIHKLKRTGVTFRSRKPLPLDPYTLGIIIGDGSIKDGTPGVTTADPEIEEVLVACAERRDLYIREEVQAGNAATTYRLSSGHRAQRGRAGGTNSLTNDLRQLDLWGKGSSDKFIPWSYKVASRESRLELLAGLIDADGYLHHNNHVLTTASEQLAEDVAFVARSLGFAAYIYSTSKRCQTGYEGDYFRVSIAGDNSTIPCRLERKTAPPRRQKKDPTRTGFTLQEVGEGEFFGFSLTGDGRFLLGDFTITHNSGKTVAFQGAPYISPHPGMTVILYPLRALVKDQTRRFKSLGLPAVTLYGETPINDRPAVYDKIRNGSAKFLLTTPESFDMNRKLQQVLAQRGVNVLAVDEAHAYEEWADGFRPVYRRAGRVAQAVGVRQFLLCSATLTEKGYRTASDTIGTMDWTVVQVPPIRKNLVYRDLSEPGTEIIARAVRGDGLDAPGIVFFTTVKCLNETADFIEKKTQKKVLRYHGSLSGVQRKKAQEEFMQSDCWIFATKAFGMGIDKDNIRNIIHYQVPSSVLSYAQECGRSGRDGYESTCWLTQEEHAEAAYFLTDISVPSIGQVRRVWNLLQAIALDWGEWFEVDWQEVAERARMHLPAVQSCVSWLFTGRMLEKKQKRLSWKFTIHDDSDEMAIKYKRRTPEVLDILRGEAMAGQGSSEFFLKPDVLADSVGQIFVGWRAKLRKMSELGILHIEEPPKGRSRYRFLHNSFEFAQGEQQLKQARKSAFNRLNEMKGLQKADPRHRSKMIEDAISLKLTSLDGVEILESNYESDERRVVRAPKPKPKMVVTSDDFDDGDEWTVTF